MRGTLPTIQASAASMQQRKQASASSIVSTYETLENCHTLLVSMVAGYIICDTHIISNGILRVRYQWYDMKQMRET